MKNLFSSVIFVVITVACFSLSVQGGDKQADRELFDKVSSKLDKGGSYFDFQSTKYLFRAIEDTYVQLPAAIKVVIPEPQQQMMAMMIYNCLKPVVQNLGINEMLAGGSSSILIVEKTDKKTALFRSRQFVYHGDKKPEGLIWDFAAEKNRELSSLAALPKETLFASATQTEPGKIWSKVKIIFSKLPFPMLQSAPMLAEQTFFNNFQVKLPEFLGSLGGIWSSTIISAKSASGKPAVFVMLKIPNKNNLVFKVLSQIAKSKPGMQVLPDEIKSTTPPVLTWVKPLIRSDGENIYVVSNAKILEIIKNTAAKKDGLSSTPEFKHLAQGLPEKGIAFFYFNNRTIEVIIDIIKANAPTGNKDWSVLTKLFPPCDLFMVATREKDGIMHVMNSPIDLPQFIAYTSVMPSIVQLATVLPALGKARTNARRISCMSNLKQIGLSLKMYAMDHKDKFPGGNNAAGLNELVKADYLTDMLVYACPNSKTVKAVGKELKETNSSYIYIGGFTEGDGPEIPMVLDKLDKNKKIINVLYQDGHVASMSKTFNTCEALINHLAKSSKFSPEVLKKLQEKARQIDKELGYK